MISASRCRLLSNGAGAWACAGMVAATTLTRAARIKRRAITFRLGGNRAAAKHCKAKSRITSRRKDGREEYTHARGRSVHGCQSLESCCYNGGKPRRCWQRGDFVLFNPEPFAQLFIEHRLTCNPARRKRQDHEMALDAVLLIAHDGLAEARQRYGLYREARFLAHFARHRLMQGLADLDHAAGQAEQASSGGAGTPHHQDPSVAHNGGAGGEEGAVWIASGVGHRYGSLTGDSGRRNAGCIEWR